MCKCQDGVIEATGELCPCGIAAQAALYPNADDNVDEQWADPEPENIRSLVTHDAHGRYLVYYDCFEMKGRDDHYKYLTAEEFLEAGGKPEDLERIRHGGIHVLFLHGKPCPHCKREERDHEFESELMLGW